MARAAEELGGKEIAAFLCQPGVPDHFSSLPWEESAAGCVIIDGLLSHKGTLDNVRVLGTGVAHYLGQCLHLSRFLFGVGGKAKVGGKSQSQEKSQEKSSSANMNQRQTLLVLCGVRAAASALAKLCSHTRCLLEIEKLVLGVRGSDLLTAADFYIGTLSTSNPFIDQGMVELQVQVGLAVMSFYSEYIDMITSMRHTSRPVSEKNPGKSKSDSIV